MVCKGSSHALEVWDMWIKVDWVSQFIYLLQYDILYNFYVFIDRGNFKVSQKIVKISNCISIHKLQKLRLCSPLWWSQPVVQIVTYEVCDVMFLQLQLWLWLQIGDVKQLYYLRSLSVLVLQAPQFYMDVCFRA